MKIPNNIANGCPERCPVCKKKCLVVFRTWKPTGKVSVVFHHRRTKVKPCFKTYVF
jgi:hypothetical protein